MTFGGLRSHRDTEHIDSHQSTPARRWQSGNARQRAAGPGRRARVARIAGCGVAAIALMVTACTNGDSPSTGGTKVQGGTAIYALPPSPPPNYIFPMASGTYFNVANVAHLQYFLYRPLYWFGKGSQPTLNESLSLADQPHTAASRSRSR